LAMALGAAAARPARAEMVMVEKRMLVDFGRWC
jgi:hypothetical protein